MLLSTGVEFFDDMDIEEPKESFGTDSYTDRLSMALPDELKRLKQFLLWRYEPPEEAGKKDLKVPYYSKGVKRFGPQGAPEDRAAMVSFSEALRVFESARGRYTGIGIAMFPQTGLVGVDLDDCLTPGGGIDPERKHFVEGTYTEVSPSGNGVRAFYRGTYGNRSATTPKVEVFGESGFLTLTGKRMNGDGIIPLPAKVKASLDALFAGQATKSTRSDQMSKVKAADPIYQMLVKSGSVLKEYHDGKIGITCPFASEHKSGSGESSTVYFMPHTNGYDHGTFVCKHVHCAGRTQGDFLKAIELMTDVYDPRSCRPESDFSPPAAESPCKSYHLTDTGNGQRFADQHRDIVKYCYPANRWFAWDGTRWKPDSEGSVRQLAKQTTRGIYQEAAREPDPEKSQKIGKWAAASESSFRQEAMLKMAQSEPGIPVLPEQMDTNRWLLNVQNGTIDLKTGELLPHRKSDLITKMVPVKYDPDATCSRWLEFLETIMAGDDEMVNYLCRVAGYALTGDAGAQCLFVCHGNGQNGKSTYLNVKQSILEDYALQTGFDTFTIKKNEGIRNDIARMRTARMVVAIETGDGKRLDEQVVKQLTGGDKVTARFLHQEHFEFRPQFKVFLAANQKPTIYGQDFAIWRRVKLIPFDVKIPPETRINNYERVLLEEKEGILNWMVFGCLEWQRIGLADPEKVKMATEAYRSEMDVLEEFIDSCCMMADGLKTSHGILYAAYEGWCEESKEVPFKTRTFAKMLQSRGFNYTKVHHLKTWKGIGLRG